MDPSRPARLTKLVDHAGHLLPAQGPISIFVHHNTLHAFEHLPFDTAVVDAGERFGCEPFLPEARYRDELERGRITEADLGIVLETELGEAGEEKVGPTTRRHLRLCMLRHPIDRPRGAELAWVLGETRVLDRFGAAVSAEARREVVEGTRRSLEHGTPSAGEERAALRALWGACGRLAEKTPAPPTPARERIRHRDLLLEVTGEDSDARVHPILIRWSAAFLDQGLAMWRMPYRELGLYRAWLRLTGARAPDDAATSAVESLDALGVAEDDWPRFLEATLLALRGWAGMIRQLELRPDRVPALPVPARLVDFAALRLLVERRVLAELAEDAGVGGPLAELRDRLRPRIPPPAPPVLEERAFVFFQVAQALGWSAALIDGLSGPEAAAVAGEIEGFPELERRRLFHFAYERRYRIEILDSLRLHASSPPVPAPEPAFQAVFCIDERSESMRRHLEEVEPAAETWGYAGFFGVAMYYRGAADARPTPLCPVVIRPSVEVDEVVVEERRRQATRRARARRLIGRSAHALSTGSRGLARGAVVSALAGSLMAFPLVLRVVFPRVAARLRQRAARFVEPPSDTRLRLERDEAAGARPALGTELGFSVEEMAAIVRGLLEETGLSRRLSPLVIVVGHGSSSLNNPHESAHDCGACGGGRGGPNARAFAMMANDPRVRARLAESGLAIPVGTRFLGASNNSCDDSVVFFDVRDLPDSHADLYRRARRALDEARARNAHERCRRFESAPLDLDPDEALAHVEARAEDLAQVRPEYGHATNASCVVGRRARTRGLFLDRRAFLVSYDPTRDDEGGAVLERVLLAIAPVCAGISLEYYFSYVDPAGFGCATKLPHNIVSLLGVMDGHQSDLRPGLPWQMVEIHEPVRLLLVVETRPETLQAVLGRNAGLERLVTNRWIQLATLSPTSSEVRVWSTRRGSFVPHRNELHELPVVGSSFDWYEGRREHLRCARIVPGRHATTLEAP